MSNSGFTNDSKELTRVIKWVQEAIEDGWEAKPMYENHESVFSAAKLEKDGWIAHALMRIHGDKSKWAFETAIHVWAPDTLSVNPRQSYNWEALKKSTKHCQYCGTDDVETTRMSFAGRACLSCREDPKVIAKAEPRGWTS